MYEFSLNIFLNKKFFDGYCLGVEVGMCKVILKLPDRGCSLAILLLQFLDIIYLGILLADWISIKNFMTTLHTYPYNLVDRVWIICQALQKGQ